jgi:hypothetical protein
MDDPAKMHATIAAFQVLHSNGAVRWFRDGHEACRFASGRVHDGGPARAVPKRIGVTEARLRGLA